MKRFSIFLLFCGYLFTLSAVTPANATDNTPRQSQAEESKKVVAADSIVEEDGNIHDLDEFVVEGQTQRTIKHGVEYMPDEKRKKMALDAVSLLSIMSIPQLRVNPMSQSVTTAAGDGVSFFINYLPATQQDLAGLRTEDVIRIEVLDFPEDPRFRSAQHVVNFIMKVYEWGGYTKLTATGNTFNYERGNGVIYSKFSYKGWTFDANAAGTYTYSDKDCSYNTQTFRDFFYDGNHVDELIRTTIRPSGQGTKSNAEWASLRAAYTGNSVQLIHQISFFRSGDPTSSILTEETFSLPLLPSTSAITNSYSQSISPEISGKYYFNLPNSNTITADWSFRYSANRVMSRYTLEEMDPLVNNNRESAYSPNITIAYSKGLGHSNTLRTQFINSTNIYSTEYAGTFNQTQDMTESENLLFLEYMQNWACGLNLYSRVGISSVYGRLNGRTFINQWNPRIGLTLQYQKMQHYANIGAFWGNNHPSPSNTNDAIIQIDELSWLEGNPELRNCSMATVYCNYSYIPNNRFSLSTGARYEGELNCLAQEYRVSPDYNGVIKRIVNKGDFNKFSGFINLGGYFFNRTLSLGVSGNIEQYHTTSYNPHDLTNIYALLNATYIFRNFSATAFYVSPYKQMILSTGDRASARSLYGVTLNYSTGNFKASLNFYNWFDSNREYSTSADFHHYSYSGWNYNSSRAMYLNLTLSYTFRYGKLLNPDNELQTSGHSNSAILQ